jgi:hypothetical protein
MDIVLCIVKCWWKGWKGLFLSSDEPIFPTWYCLWMTTNSIIFFFLVKRGSKWTLLDQWRSWGIIVSTNIVYHQIEYRNQILIGCRTKVPWGQAKSILSMDFIYALWVELWMEENFVLHDKPPISLRKKFHTNYVNF